MQIRLWCALAQFAFIGNLESGGQAAKFDESYAQLIFVMVKCCVLFDVRSEFLNIIQTNVDIEGFAHFCLNYSECLVIMLR
jgi:hypothetical protein